MVAKHTFSPEDCARIVALGDEAKPGTIQGGEDNPQLRSSHVAWIEQDPPTRWIYERLRPKLEAANDRYLHLELTGFTEPLQLAEYGPGQHYNWHIDFGPGKFRIRKLSFVVPLTDPTEYDGGTLEIATDSRPAGMARDQGALIMFPAYVMHRVTQVTRGLRRSLVGWIGGPPLT